MKENNSKSILLSLFDSMCIGNIHWKHCRLETLIEIRNMYWRLKFTIGSNALEIVNDSQIMFPI